jgi:prepilin peptidase CpaA
MATLEVIRTVVLIATLGAAVITDLRRRVIPNWLTVSACILGLGLGTLDGLGAAAPYVGGAVVMAAVCVPLFSVRVLGGGDVKLLIAVGALVGIGRLPAVFAFTCAAGALLALLDAARHHVVVPLVLDCRDALTYYITLGRRGRPMPVGTDARLSVPYAVAIGIGTLAAWFI